MENLRDRLGLSKRFEKNTVHWWWSFIFSRELNTVTTENKWVCALEAGNEAATPLCWKFYIENFW